MVKETQLKLDIGMRIKEARMKTGVTQGQIADRMDITMQSVSNMESGKHMPSLLHLMRLCGLLGVSCDYILFGKEPKEMIVPDIFRTYLRMTPERRKFLDVFIREFGKLN